MPKRKYLKDKPERSTYPSDTQLPTNQPVAVYYRQSTEAQIGNISTTMQTVDMIAELRARGWNKDDIIMIDMDGGVSGTLKIDERPGMRHLFELITERAIAAVACQDEDRLFRDVTMIQVNIFIEACKKAHVKVITPTFIYDFAHPDTGPYHTKMFRQRCEMAAEFIETYLRRRLHVAKRRQMLEGRWSGGMVPLGYMVDERKTLPDGSKNDHWRRYVPYEPFAEIIRRYFEIFLNCGGNLNRTFAHIMEEGPFFPAPNMWEAPPGFRFLPPRQMRNYGRGYSPAQSGLQGLLTNAAYIGHWHVNDVIVHRNLHPPIVDEQTFMRAFNYLSPMTLDGEPNPEYRPFHFASRPSRDSLRPVERPLCAGMIFTRVNNVWLKAGTSYRQKDGYYSYYVDDKAPLASLIWSRKADYLDQLVVEWFRKKFLATFQPDRWESSLDEASKAFQEQRRSQQKQLKTLDDVMRNLLANLEVLSDVTLIQHIEKRYQETQAEYDRLRNAITESQSELSQFAALADLKTRCGPALENWPNLTTDEKRSILHAFIHRIEVESLDGHALRVILHWRDGTLEETVLAHKGTTYTTWSKESTDHLLMMVRNGATQVEIAAAFPFRKWEMIRQKYSAVTGVLIPLSGSQPIRDFETYEEYLQRTGDGKIPYRARNGERWRPKDSAKLETLLDSGATQVEIAAAFPHRNWAALRYAIRRVRGHGFKVLGVGQVRKYETYEMYCMRIQQDS